MEFQNSNHLQHGPFFSSVACINQFYFGSTLEYFKLWEAAIAYFL